MSTAPALRLALVVGARPNFMKAAPILEAFRAVPRIEITLVHTGQHYDAALSDVFFQELGMRRPDAMLAVGSGTHGAQTASIIARFEEWILAERQAGRRLDGVIVVGDVNSTMACALVAAKLLIPVIHVEAGLRSMDRTMPEEINRVVTDSISDLMLCSEPAGVTHLLAEGRPRERIELVGNVMIDTLRRFEPDALERPMLAELGLLPRGYGVVTLHRPANVDDPATLGPLLERLQRISRRIPLVFSVHPRTAARIRELGFDPDAGSANFLMLPPQGYVDFLCLTAQARLIITDSGGLQDESTALGVPCLTLRPNTERPVTVEEGSSRLIGSDWELLDHLVDSVLDGEFALGTCPALWDGRSGERIAASIARYFGIEIPTQVVERTQARAAA